MSSYVRSRACSPCASRTRPYLAGEELDKGTRMQTRRLRSRTRWKSSCDAVTDLLRSPVVGLTGGLHCEAPVGPRPQWRCTEGLSKEPRQLLRVLTQWPSPRPRTAVLGPVAGAQLECLGPVLQCSAPRVHTPPRLESLFSQQPLPATDSPAPQPHAF